MWRLRGCCHPIEVRYTVEDGAVCDFEASVLTKSAAGRKLIFRLHIRRVAATGTAAPVR